MNETLDSANTSAHIKIKDLATQDRPREKMLAFGPQALTDSELLGIIIGSGQVDRSAVDIAREILARFDNNVTALGSVSLPELLRIKGIGQARAVNILAALELGRRRNRTSIAEKTKVANSNVAFHILHPYLADLDHEELWMLLLNRQNQLISVEKLSEGGLSGTVFDVRIAIRKALDLSASAIILAHNHPSGTAKPSTNDDQITSQLYEAGKLMQIPLRDHIIVLPGAMHDELYYSYADNNYIIK